MTEEERRYGVCANCEEQFALANDHISYGGLLWCTEECLAETVVDRDIEVEKVEQKMEHR